MIRLRFDRILAERGITIYQLWKDTGLAKNTAYTLGRSAPRSQVDLPTIEKAMLAIAQRSGHPVSLTDVFEQTNDDPLGYKK